MPLITPGGSGAGIVIPIEGEDKDFVASVDRVNKKIKELEGVVKTNKAQLEQSNKSVNVLKGSWTEFRSAYSTVLDAVRVGQQVWAATGGEFIKYAEEVKNLSRNIGVTAEDASRLIQVADDVRISYASLGTALKLAQKQGIDVSAEGLAKLADQYKSLQPGIERTQFLLKTFGKSGMEMGKLMEMGGAGIRKANGEVNDMLVLTEDAIKESDAYQRKLDDLNDSVGALSKSIGKALVPAMTDAATIANANVTAFTTFGDVLDGKVKLNDWAANIINANNVWEETGEITEDNTDSFDNNSEALDDNKSAVKAAEGALKDYKDMLEQVSEANQDAESFIQSYADFQKGYEDDHKKAIEDIRDAEAELDKVMEPKEGTKYNEWQAEIGAANAKIFEAKDALKDLEATWHESTQKMIYDMIMQKVSVDGLTNAEFKATQQLAVTMGIRTQAEADTANAMMDTAQAAADGIALQEDVMAEKKATDADLLALEQERAIAAGETTGVVVSGSGAQAQAIGLVIARTDSATLSMIRYGEAAQRALSMAGGISNRAPLPFTGFKGYGGKSPDERDSGGAGIAGTPYMIGTGAQPEAFIPSTNGTFIPNADKKLGGTVYNITVNNPKKETAENSIRSALKNLSYMGQAA